jgi:hypothetical protein
MVSSLGFSKIAALPNACSFGQWPTRKESMRFRRKIKSCVMARGLFASSIPRAEERHGCATEESNHTKRGKKGIDTMKRFVPRFGSLAIFDSESESTSSPGKLRLSNRSDAPAVQEPRTRSAE